MIFVYLALFTAIVEMVFFWILNYRSAVFLNYIFLINLISNFIVNQLYVLFYYSFPGSDDLLVFLLESGVVASEYIAIALYLKRWSRKMFLLVILANLITWGTGEFFQNLFYGLISQKQ